jgi:hypothetical protein
MTPCPSELKLERHLLEPAAEIVAHLGECQRCRSRHGQMLEDGERFARFIFPATVEPLVQRRARGRGSWLRALGWLALPAGALTTGLVAWLTLVPPSSYVGSKGPAVSLTVYAQAQGTATAVQDGQSVPAGAALRFRVQANRACHLWLVSVDQTGLISQLFPAQGELSSEKRIGGALPGGALLDGRPGPERLFAVCSEKPISLTELQHALKESVPMGANGVRDSHILSDLPGAGQASILLEKAR